MQFFAACGGGHSPAVTSVGGNSSSGGTGSSGSATGSSGGTASSGGSSGGTGNPDASPPPSSQISIVPPSATLAPGGTQTFACTVTGLAGAACTWSVKEGAAGGAITAAGVYTAPVEQGTYHVVATSQAQTSLTATATAIVPPPATGTPGQWVNVTPANASATATFSCTNFGTETIQVDPMRPSDLYTEFMCQGIWKSTDYGQTWTGPINTGANGATVGDCAGGITMPPVSTASPPIVYQACIRGNATGFWASTNGGVDWTTYNIPGGMGQDVYPPSVDPYDDQHLLITGHEKNQLLESTNGGQTWTNIVLASGMMQNGGTALLFFVDTGSAATTATTWLYLPQVTGGTIGTWRTPDGGQTWTQVDTNEHPHGSTQIYQPGSGVVYAAGLYSNMNTWWGVRRSTDYGKTWANAGSYNSETIVYGTPKNVYAMYGWANLSGAGGGISPTLEVGAQPGTGTWTMPTTPTGMAQDGASQAAVTSDGTHSVVVLAAWNSGLWRYIEP